MAVVVVTHDSSRHVDRLGSLLLPQLRSDDELAVVDNASADGSAEIARRLGGPTRVIETGANLGFAGGCRVGVEATSAPLILFLNPDSDVEPACLDALREAADQHPDWGAWQALVVLEDGTRVNSMGGVTHYLGFGWAGGCGTALDGVPRLPYETSFPSGAALMVRRDVWNALGGFDDEYFMYGEDLDLGLRTWLSGSRVGVVPAARVRHHYDFEKGPSKWFLLERNRWRTVLSVYPGSLLVLLAPALIAFELALLAVALRGGWLGAKVRSQLAALAGLPATARRRRRVQGTRRLGACAFAAQLTPSLDSQYLRAPGPAAGLQALYWRAVVRALEFLHRTPPGRGRGS